MNFKKIKKLGKELGKEICNQVKIGTTEAKDKITETAQKIIEPEEAYWKLAAARLAELHSENLSETLLKNCSKTRKERLKEIMEEAILILEEKKFISEDRTIESSLLKLKDSIQKIDDNMKKPEDKDVK